MKHLFAVAAFGVCLVGAAQAQDSITVKKFADNDYGSAKIKFNGKIETVNAGPFAASLNGGSVFEAYCVDLAHNNSFPSTYSVNISDAATSIHNGDKVAQLYNAFSTKVNNDSWAAALQLAIWYEVYDGTGQFQILDVNKDIQKNLKTIANTDLSKYSTQLSFFGAVNHGANGSINQNLVGRAPVPEPGTMVALALGLVGAASRRRKRSLA